MQAHHRKGSRASVEAQGLAGVTIEGPYLHRTTRGRIPSSPASVAASLTPTTTCARTVATLYIGTIRAP